MVAETGGGSVPVHRGHEREVTEVEKGADSPFRLEVSLLFLCLCAQ